MESLKKKLEEEGHLSILIESNESQAETVKTNHRRTRGDLRETTRDPSAQGNERA